ncbi:hypothetical protein QR98_0104710 [Sarcoptes scabiei]|uniref:Uncharacterized protein n=1 Tax=Sarcoptes scabiei TaxID=52283 RepID=A0A132ALW6_SARSC|nr:hypothetical protein QR98_0104710 [Sarcoptes scabiei]
MSIDAPEDEDFGDFQHIENDAPEAIQAITAGPNFAYPDVNKHSVNFNRSKKQTSKTRMDPIPSTSNEKQIEQLKIKQELLMRTIRFQNDQISDLMERVIANEPKNDNTIANESSDQRIDTAIRRLESVVESSFSRMNNRIDSLESKINCSLIPSECLKNGELSKPLIDVHLIRLMEQIKEISEHQREQNLQTFTRIIRAALDEINLMENQDKNEKKK